MTDPRPPSIARALGRIPSGLYIVTSEDEAGRPLGFLGSLVMQTGFEPPMVLIAVGSDRPHLSAIRARGRFALSVLDAASRGLMRSFLKPPPEGGTVFDGLAVRKTPTGLLVLSDALSWLECELRSEHPTGDHVCLFGEVLAAELLREGDPHVHLRKNGLGY